MTLRARDEADIVDAQIAFHLNAGVDFVIALDHRSTDGTAEILDSYASEGVLHLLRVPDEGIDRRWVTDMARLAATDFGADWVVNSDADEFWWPRGGSLKEVLSAVPERCGVVRAPWRQFVPRPDDGAFFAERMVFRLSPFASINSPSSPTSSYRPSVKVAHRADPRVRVARGNHQLLEGPARPLGWHPIEVLHFRLRSLAQCARKFANSWQAWSRKGGSDSTTLIAAGHQAQQQGALHDFYDSVAVGAGALARGLESGSLVVDTRVRDALRSLRLPAPVGARAFALPGEKVLELPRPGLEDEARFAIDVDALRDGSSVRLARRLDLLAGRVTAVSGSLA